MASDGEAFERYLRMPHGFEFKGAAEMFGLDYYHITEVAGVRQALEACLPKPGVQIIEVILNPEREMDRWRAVNSALQDLTP